MTEQSSATEKHERPRFQYTLRALLVFMLLVSIPLSWLGGKLLRTRRLREAVEAIVRAGGRVWYAPYDESTTFERDFIADVTDVFVTESDFGDEALYLKQLPSLETLCLARSRRQKGVNASPPFPLPTCITAPLSRSITIVTYFLCPFPVEISSMAICFRCFNLGLANRL